jgi:hypothetical protein
MLETRLVCSYEKSSSEKLILAKLKISATKIITNRRIPATRCKLSSLSSATLIFNIIITNKNRTAIAPT